MPKIPFTFEPERDELLISYMHRLSEYNCIQSMSAFLTTYIFLDRVDRNNCQIKLDANRVFNDYFESEDVPINRMEFYLQHGIYGGIAPLLTAGQQMQIVNEAFGRRDIFPELCTPSTSMIDALMICPECEKEDIQKIGERYFHKMHHMPGVKICAKHGCALRKCVSRTPLMNRSELRFETVSIENEKWEKRYAAFAADFLEACIDANIMQIKGAAFKKMQEMNYKNLIYQKNDYVNLKEQIETEKITALMDVDIDQFLKVSLIRGSYADKQTVLALLCFLFGTVTELKRYLDFDQELALSFIEQAQENYDVFEPFLTTIMEMRRKETGENFVSTAYGFLSGWREPTADMDLSAQKKFAEMFENITDETYILNGTFQSMDKTVEIYHTICGSTIRPRARAFLLEGVRCPCESKFSFGKATRMVEKHDGFHLVSFSGTEKECTILHDLCGKEFTCIFKKFISSPTCRICYPRGGISFERFQEEVRELVGDEYVALQFDDSKKMKAIMRHERCGTVFKMLPGSFLRGNRCTKCRDMYPEDDFRQIVSRLSLGRYQVGRRLDTVRNIYEIMDTETGKIQQLEQKYIIQELKRPTMSEVLPLNKKANVDDRINKSVVLELFLRKHYAANDLIFLEDVKIEGMDYPVIKRAFQNLCKHKIVYNQMDGIYSLTSFDATAERVIYEKYICRGHQVIGFLYGESLAYELGILNEKPDMIYIVTNKEAVLHGRVKTVLGKKIRIRGSETLVTDENYKILQVLDMLRMRFRFGWNVYPKLREFVKENRITLDSFDPYIELFAEHVRNDLSVLYDSGDINEKTKRKVKNS